MEDKNKITEEELNILNNLNIILTKYNISKENYIISEEYQNSEHIKICLVKTKIGKWNTCLKLNAGVFDSIYHSSLSTASIKFLEYVAPNTDEYLLMLQDFLNLCKPTLTSNKSIKNRRKKR